MNKTKRSTIISNYLKKTVPLPINRILITWSAVIKSLNVVKFTLIIYQREKVITSQSVNNKTIKMPNNNHKKKKQCQSSHARNCVNIWDSHNISLSLIHSISLLNMQTIFFGCIARFIHPFIYLFVEVADVLVVYVVGPRNC